MRNAPMAEGGGGQTSMPPTGWPEILPVRNATKPYWRTQLHSIDSHRSTAELPFECDIAIIGAGLSGVGTAYHLSTLADPGHRPSILMLEARQVCSGATGRNGGHAKVQTNTLLKLARTKGLETAETFASFINDNIHALKHTVETEGLDCEFELRRSFDVFLAQGEAEAVTNDFKKSLAEDHGYTRDRDLLDHDITEQVTSIKGAQAAISCTVGSFWPYKFVSQLLSGLVNNGTVNLQTNTLVTSVQDTPNGSRVNTSRGCVQAKKVVFATNAYTAGICQTYVDHIIPYRGTACHITPTNGPISPHLSNTYNISYAPDRVDYLNPRPDGGIVVGGGKWVYEDLRFLWFNNWDDSCQLPGVREEHFDGLMQRHFRGWENSGARVDHIWTGVQAYTADSFPQVGKVPGKGDHQYVLAGFNGGGNGLCFLCARGVAEMVLHGTPFEETGVPSFFNSIGKRFSESQ